MSQNFIVLFEYPYAGMVGIRIGCEHPLPAGEIQDSVINPDPIMIPKEARQVVVVFLRTREDVSLKSVQ